MSARIRADHLLVARGLVESREQARRLILAGSVVVGDHRVDKPGSLCDSASTARIKSGARSRYVSRGGDKLQHALAVFGLAVNGVVALDVGASTGGFTDCLLQNGAARVFAVDVGYGQLAWSLRQNARVISLERRNIRSLHPSDLDETPSMAVIDASFISLRLVIPKVVTLLTPDAIILALVKPQFEVGKGQVGKGGVVRDPAQHREVLDGLRAHIESHKLRVKGAVQSPLRGAKGNTEFFLYLQKTPCRAPAMGRGVCEGTLEYEE